MNESISRAAGASHGQEAPPEVLEATIRAIGRTPRQRRHSTASRRPSRSYARSALAAARRPSNPSVNDARLKAPPRLVRPGLRSAAR